MEEGDDSTLIDPASTVQPITEDDWIIHSINIHGAFFERACRRMIEGTSPWKVQSYSVPVEFPPPADHGRGKESNLDIWATFVKRSGHNGGKHILSLLIECKKNNPEFVKWVFFSKHAEEGRRRGGNNTDTIAIRDVTMWSDSRAPHDWGWAVRPRVMRRWFEHLPPVADEARETRGAYKDFKNPAAKTKTANTAITEAAYQVALATQAVFSSETEYLTKKSAGADMSVAFPLRELPWAKQFFLPVIVTTAQLFTCDFKPEDIDPKSGVIPLSKATLTERPEILFEYPLPRHLQAMPSSQKAEEDGDDIELYSRMQILVVNSGHFPEFLRKWSAEVDRLFDF